MAKQATAAFDLEVALDTFLRQYDATFDALLVRPTVDADLDLLRDTLARHLAHVPRAEWGPLVRAAAFGYVQGLAACITEARRTSGASSDTVH